MIRNSARPFLLVAATLICWSTLPAPALADTVSFVGRRDFASGGLWPSSVAVGDFNGDGIPDLAVVPGGFPLNIVSVLLGNGDGTFQAARNFATGAHSVSVAVGDFNRDGVPDLAVVNFTSSSVSVLLGNGDGTF